MNKQKVARELVKLARAIMSGCEKLPEGPMRDNCEKKKEEGKDKKEASRRKTAKPEIDFQDIAKKLDEMIDEIDSHMNVYQRDYDRPVASRIDRATRFLIEAKEAFEDTEAYDEDPLG